MHNGGSCRAYTYRVLRLMYGDGGLYRAYRAFMVLRFMYGDGGLYRAFRVLRLMYSDGWLYRAFMACRVLRPYGPYISMVMDGYIGHLWNLGC